MTKLTDQLAPLFARLPEAEQAARRALWERLASEGFPTRRHERWRFTDLPGALPEDLPESLPQTTEAAPAQITLPRIEGLERLAFVNGRSSGLDNRDRRSFAGELPAVEDASDLVNATLATGGIDIALAAGETRAPVHLCTRCTAGSTHLRHRLRLGRDAHATLYWDDAVIDDAVFVSQTLELDLAPGAELRLVRSHSNRARGPVLLRTQARLAEGAKLHCTAFDSGSGLTRHNLHVWLETAARTDLQGVYAPFGTGQIDTFASIEHSAPESVSRMRLRGLGMDRGIGVLTGRVHVHPGAQKADSDQQLSSLLLSPRAQINAKPELEIYADDVTCAHGNAIGQIDVDALHYLQTRGVPRDTARALLIGGFAAETLAVEALPVVQDALLHALDAALSHADWSAA